MYLLIAAVLLSGIPGALIGVLLGAVLGGEWADNLRLVAGTAGLGSCGGFLLLLAAFWDLSRRWMGQQERSGPERISEQFVRTAGNQWALMDELPDVPHHAFRRWIVNAYLDRNIQADDRVTISQRSADQFGIDRPGANAVVEWLVDRGWYICERGHYNNSGGGRFTEQGERALKQLSEGEAWEAVLTTNNHSPAPNGDNRE